MNSAIDRGAAHETERQGRNHNRRCARHGRAAQWWQPSVKGYVRQENGICNHWRLEQAWLER